MDFTNGFTMSPNSEDQFSNLINEYTLNQLSPPTTDLNFLQSPNLSSDLDLGPNDFEPLITTVGPEEPEQQPYDPPLVDVPADSSSPDDGDFSETVLTYISQILMEENIEDKPCMFYDPLGLKVTEKSFYDALGKKYHSSPNQNSVDIESPVFSTSSGEYGATSTISTSTSSTTGNDFQWLNDDLGEHYHNYQASFSQAPINPGEYNVVQSNLKPTDQSRVGDGLEFLAQNIFTDSESVLQFRRGLEEASKFLPKSNNLVIDLESNMVSSSEWKGDDQKVESLVVKGEKDVKESSKESTSPDGVRGRKNHEREEIELEEGRSNKQTAVYVEETELSDMFDKVLLWTDAPAEMCGNCEPLQDEGSKASLQQNAQAQGGSGGKSSRNKKQGKKKETIDLRSLLILCAQAVSTGDGRTANELLKQIRQHSTPFGDGSQRLAHFFANGLEARLAGSVGTQIGDTSLVSKRVSAAEMLKSYKVHLSACPFKRMTLFFANKMIWNLAEKATSLHIVDFGIGYGFHWPILIQHLSKRPDGAPKLRITGIDLPQPGFRPAENIEETGRRLAKYCNRFNVPFEYHAIASQNWETIRIEELKIDRQGVLAVHCQFQFKHLLDETVEGTSPRNAVLNLIRRMNPDIFVNAIVNGSYNAPFFLTRFREALFHFSALYDMFDVTIPRDNQQRLMFERQFYGREAMNVIACEGLERVERPETYKQCQVRTLRAGFKQLPLDQELMSKFRGKMKAWYHKDFILDEDNHWMLQGWKGRIVYASSCWVPA